MKYIDLFNSSFHDSLVDFQVEDGMYIDLHNDFYYDRMLYRKDADTFTISLLSNDDKIKIELKFFGIELIEHFRNHVVCDEKVSIDMLSKGELFPKNEFYGTDVAYFFAMFTDGIQVDVFCRGFHLVLHEL